MHDKIGKDKLIEYLINKGINITKPELKQKNFKVKDKVRVQKINLLPNHLKFTLAVTKY
jgi:hypothetical protein